MWPASAHWLSSAGLVLLTSPMPMTKVFTDGIDEYKVSMRFLTSTSPQLGAPSVARTM